MHTYVLIVVLLQCLLRCTYLHLLTSGAYLSAHETQSMLHCCLAAIGKPDITVVLHPP